MTSNREGDDDRITEAEFETELERLVAAARDDGVRLVGSYDVRDPDPASRDFTVEITRVRKRPSDEYTV